MSMMLGNDDWLEPEEDDSPCWGWGVSKDEMKDDNDCGGIGIGHKEWIDGKD